MRRLTMWAAAFLAAALLFAPAIALAQKPNSIAPAYEVGGSIAESRWAGRVEWANGETRDWTAYFRSDGVLVYSYLGETYDNGRWRQRDLVVSFDTNDHYAVHVGVINGRRMEGTMYNVVGNRGVWAFTRQ